MGFFTKKTTEKVDLTLESEIKLLKGRVILLESQILDVATAQNILRNKVLKKIQFKNPKDDEDEPKDLYNGMLIAEK